MKTIGLILASALVTTSANAFNVPKHPTKPYDCTACVKLSHESLQDKWEISESQLNTKVSNLQRSYSYREFVSLKKLQNGVSITTTAPGAVVRIVPLDGNAIPALKLNTPDSKVLSLKEASTLYSEDEPFGDERFSSTHQNILQIKQELGAGRFLLKTDDAVGTQAKNYLISVYDKFSSSYLEVSTNAIHYQYGDILHASIALKDIIPDCSVDDIEAELIGPEGQSIPLSIKKVGVKQFDGRVKLNSEFNDRGENWYVEVSVNAKVGDHILKRSAHAAFSYTVPSASLISVKKLSSKPLTFLAAVDVATASRYALQSVLYRKKGKNGMVPIETSQRAQWLEPGKQLIQFTFDNSRQFAEDTLYLGYFRLTDYGQMSVVYQFNQPLKLSQLVE